MKEELVKFYKEYLEAIDKYNHPKYDKENHLEPTFEGFMWYLEYGFVME